MATFKQKMAAAKKRWAKAREHANEFGSDVDDGTYLARLTGAEIGESQSSGRAQIDWAYKIEEGLSGLGETVHSYDGLETDDNLKWLARTIGKFGVESPDDFDDLEDTLNEILARKPLCRIRLRTKDDFQNLRILRVFGSEEEDSELAEGETGEEGGDEGEEVEGDDGDSDEGDGLELEVGMTVTAPFEGEDYQAEITAIDEDSETVTVKDTSGDEWDVSFSDVSAADDDEGEPDEGDDGEDAGDEIEITIGTRVSARIKGSLVLGKVTAIADDGESVSVKTDAGKLIRKVPTDALALAEEEPPEKPKARVRRKTGSK